MAKRIRSRTSYGDKPKTVADFILEKSRHFEQEIDPGKIEAGATQDDYNRVGGKPVKTFGSLPLVISQMGARYLDNDLLSAYAGSNFKAFDLKRYMLVAAALRCSPPELTQLLDIADQEFGKELRKGRDPQDISEEYARHVEIAEQLHTAAGKPVQPGSRADTFKKGSGDNPGRGGGRGGR